MISLRCHCIFYALADCQPVSVADLRTLAPLLRLQAVQHWAASWMHTEVTFCRSVARLPQVLSDKTAAVQ